jgi:hypothetical protein
MMKEKENVKMKIESGTVVWNKVYGEGKVVYVFEKHILVNFPIVQDYVYMTRDRLHITSRE